MSDEPTRRDLLRSASTGVAALPLLGGAYLLARVATTPAAERRPTEVALCRLEEIPKEGFVVRKINYTVSRGPVEETVGAVVFVRRDESAAGGVVALSGRCPHLGCNVTANRDVEGPPILCPCHDAAFDRDGNVLEGPPKTGLRQLQVRVPDDELELVHLIL